MPPDLNTDVLGAVRQMLRYRLKNCLSYEKHCQSEKRDSRWFRRLDSLEKSNFLLDKINTCGILY
jgi:hypothetical protein